MANTRQLDDEQPFLFPLTNSRVLPDPSKFFSKNLFFSSSLSTNSFFQNFVLNDGNIQEYIHPYLIKPSDSSLSLCYPSLSVSSHSMQQVFTPDLTISSSTDLCHWERGWQQDSNSEAVNIYYSAALMGLAYGDLHLASIGSTLASLEIHAAKMWWHVKEGDNLYEDDFAKDNKLVGYLAANHRLDLIRCYQSERECKIGFHVLPLLSITEFLFSNVDFVKDLVKWSPSLYTVGDGWMGFVYALEGIYNNKVALEKIRSLKRFDAGNTLSNLLWWIHSRHDYRKMGSCHEKQCCIG
ncbi:hypothetical protein Ahy_Scaffold8g108440 [Arachis hypogaea]|uniref:glucan endo-1,3-beta-D-glucosidase n=1 Tax=Arachis hypogaea TaxID=3818 RepID=A0A444WN73_ARAHY|nr:hypothetical protein Ahy_Scaffold8g108440 [Arachis hypogaea]